MSALNELVQAVLTAEHPRHAGLRPFYDDLNKGVCLEYALLVPSTFIMTFMSTAGRRYADWARDDETFLMSHMIITRVTARTKDFTTINGRKVTIRDGFISTKAGFPQAVKAKILKDYIHTDPITGASLAVYELGVPLIGSPTLSKDFRASEWPEGVAHEFTPPARDLDFEMVIKRFSLKIGVKLDSVIKNTVTPKTSLDEVLTTVESMLDQSISVVQRLESNQIKTILDTLHISAQRLEAMVESDVLARASPRLWPSFESIYLKENISLQSLLEQLSALNIYQLGIPGLSRAAVQPLENRAKMAVTNLQNLTSTSTINGKLDILVSTLKILAVSEGDEPNGADTIVSLLVLVLARLDEPIDLPAQLAFVRYLYPKGVDEGYVGYVMSTFEGVVGYVLDQGEVLQRLARGNKWLLAHPGSLATRLSQSDSQSDDDDDDDDNNEKLAIASSCYYSTDTLGNSLLHLAIVHSPSSLPSLYLLPQFNAEFIRYDTNLAGESILLTALHTENIPLINYLLLHIGQLLTPAQLRDYIRLPDTHNRHIGHYLFKYPYLINLLGQWIDWEAHDTNGQTPLFAICRCYDHSEYDNMVKNGFLQCQKQRPINPANHIDNSGNSLFHIVKHTPLLDQVLRRNTNVNGLNAKSLTPLMVFCRYSSVDIVDRVASDDRVDLYRNGFRGMNVLDVTRDATLLRILDSASLQRNGIRTNTHIVHITRSFSLKGEVRFVIATVPCGSSSSPLSGDIITVHRNFGDFKFLHKWLHYEHNHTWIPSLATPANPFLLPSRTSYQTIHEIQRSLNFFIRALLLHPVLASHELIWEFLLIQDISRDSIVDRCRRKLQNTNEINLDRHPLLNVLGEDQIDTIRPFFTHSSSHIRALARELSAATHTYQGVTNKSIDYGDSFDLISDCFLSRDLAGGGEEGDDDSSIQTVPRPVWTELGKIQTINDLAQVDFLFCLKSLAMAAASLHETVAVPLRRIDRLTMLRAQLAKRMVVYTQLNDTTGFLASNGLFEQKRQRERGAVQDQIFLDQNEINRLSKDIKVDHENLAVDIAGFYQAHEILLRGALRDFSRGEIRAQRERLLRLEQLLDTVRTTK